MEKTLLSGKSAENYLHVTSMKNCSKNIALAFSCGEAFVPLRLL